MDQPAPTEAQQPTPEQTQPTTVERPYPIPEGVDTSAPDFEERYANYVAKLEENKKFQDLGSTQSSTLQSLWV